VHVRIDAAGDDDFAGGVDHSARLIDSKGIHVGDCGDLAAGDRNVARGDAARGHDAVGPDDEIEGHVQLLKA
jgi:hypothetical protein